MKIIEFERKACKIRIIKMFHKNLLSARYAITHTDPFFCSHSQYLTMETFLFIV